MVEARYYRNEEESARCLLCPRSCLIGEGESGACTARVNSGGRLVAAGYGRIAALNLDPVEKKPLYHFLPGTLTLSTGMQGCNLFCRFCQNHTLARGKADLPHRVVSPGDLLGLAEEEGGLRRVPSLSFTYNEPLIAFEYISDCARLFGEKGYKTILVTNGYLEEGPLRELLPLVDAMNIDLKGYSDRFYRHYCRGDLASVLRTIEMAAGKCHVEVTTLLIPGLNDSADQLESMFCHLAAVNREIPLHLSRYFPRYNLHLEPTPAETVSRALEMAKEHLDYVYAGNIDLPAGSDSLCPGCGSLLVSRRGYRVDLAGLTGGRCARCGKRFLPEDQCS